MSLPPAENSTFLIKSFTSLFSLTPPLFSVMGSFMLEVFLLLFGEMSDSNWLSRLHTLRCRSAILCGLVASDMFGQRSSTLLPSEIIIVHSGWHHSFRGTCDYSITLKNRVQKHFHFGHQGISGIKALTRSYVYWPNMHITAQNVTIKISEKIGILFLAGSDGPLVTSSYWLFEGKCFLLLVDADIKWPEIFPTSCITFKETILKLQHIFN